MKKIMMIGMLVVALASTSMAAEKQKGGFMGFIHGCCFGARGAAAYNDGLQTPAIEWINRLLLANILSAIQGANGMTTEDFRKQFGKEFF